MQDVPSLVYTRQVIDESMRLFPPAWMNARSPIQDEELDGYFIPKGSLVFVSPYVVQHHPDYWDDPEGFDPDRFAPGRKPKHRFAYFPFGGGPRLCIGQRFALVEAVLMLAAVARRYRLDLVPGHQVVLQPAVTLRPKHGVMMVPHLR
jgi:cytochrome P450